MDLDDFSVQVDFSANPATSEPAPKKARGRPRKAPGEVAGTRNEHDAYDTHPALALACAAWLRGRLHDPTDPARGPARILEPTAGGGPFVLAARQVWPGSTVVAADVRPECFEPCIAAGAHRFAHVDALTLPPALLAQVDLVLTNPPFKLADQLVRHFWPHLRAGASIAFLLPVTFIGSSDRWELPAGQTTCGLFPLAPLAMLAPIVPRPEFTGTSPKFEAGLFVWTKRDLPAEEYPLALLPSPIRWEKPKKARK